MPTEVAAMLYHLVILLLICSVSSATTLQVRRLGLGGRSRRTEYSDVEKARQGRHGDLYLFNRCEGPVVAYAGAWFAHSSTVLETSFEDILKMEHHDFNLYHQGGKFSPRIALKTYAQRDFHVEHLSEFEHHAIRTLGFNLKSHRAILNRSFIVNQRECRHTNPRLDPTRLAPTVPTPPPLHPSLNHTKLPPTPTKAEITALVPFYGGPVDAQKGNAHSRSPPGVKEHWVQSVLCSIRNSFGRGVRVVVGVCTDVDRISMRRLWGEQTPVNQSSEGEWREYLVSGELESVIHFKCSENAYLPFKLLRHFQMKVREGAWLSQYVYFTESDQVAHLSEELGVNGLKRSIGHQVYVVPNRYETNDWPSNNCGAIEDQGTLLAIPLSLSTPPTTSPLRPATPPTLPAQPSRLAPQLPRAEFVRCWGSDGEVYSHSFIAPLTLLTQAKTAQFHRYSRAIKGDRVAMRIAVEGARSRPWILKSVAPLSLFTSSASAAPSSVPRHHSRRRSFGSPLSGHHSRHSREASALHRTVALVALHASHSTAVHQHTLTSALTHLSTAIAVYCASPEEDSHGYDWLRTIGNGPSSHRVLIHPLQCEDPTDLSFKAVEMLRESGRDEELGQFNRVWYLPSDRVIHSNIGLDVIAEAVTATAVVAIHDYSEEEWPPSLEWTAECEGHERLTPISPRVLQWLNVPLWHTEGSFVGDVVSGKLALANSTPPHIGDGLNYHAGRGLGYILWPS